MAALGFALCNPVQAQAPTEWSTIVSPDGTASVTMPCAQQDIAVRSQGDFDANRCVASGLTMDFLVVADGANTAPVQTFKSFDSFSEALSQELKTVFVKKATVNGFQTFYGEGRGANNQKVATGMVRLSDDRVVVLLLNGDDSAVADEMHASVFQRAWSSLKVIAP